LFTAKPPVTRVVVDLEAPQPYQIVPSGDSILVKLDVPGDAPSKVASASPEKPAPHASAQPADSPLAHLQSAAPRPAVHPASAHRSIPAVPATTFSVGRVPVSEASSLNAQSAASAPPGHSPFARPGPPSASANRPDPTPIVPAPYPQAGTAAPPSGPAA